MTVSGCELTATHGVNLDYVFIRLSRKKKAATRWKVGMTWCAQAQVHLSWYCLQSQTVETTAQKDLDFSKVQRATVVPFKNATATPRRIIGWNRCLLLHCSVRQAISNTLGLDQLTSPGNH